VILVDTSAWVEYFRHTGSPQDKRVTELIGDPQLATTEVILMEVLTGEPIERHERVRRLLTSGTFLPLDGTNDFEAAARLHRHCRANGVTVRRLTDCLIAIVAMREGAQVLSRDRDFDLIASCTTLRVVSV
jgi:predicted nucleic acid-binding protein